MGLIRVLSILGTRSEAVKMVPVLLAMQQTEGIESTICITAQQRHKLDQVLQLFDIHPDYDLNLMKPEQSSSKLATGIMEKLDPVLDTVRPDLVLVQGGSVTAATSTLCCHYKNIPVGCIGSGLRTGQFNTPWPEEGNRKLVSALASIHFVPDQGAKENLLKEGVAQERIVVSGCTGADGVLQVYSMLKEGSKSHDALQSRYPYLSKGRKLVVVGCKHVQNFGDAEGLRSFAQELAGHSLDTDFILLSSDEPAGLEFSTVKELAPNLFLLPQQDYLPFVYLMNRSIFIVTDSGGIQDEAPALGTPVLVMQDRTERQAAIDRGMSILVGTDKQGIIQQTSSLLADKQKYNSQFTREGAFADGQAAQRIVTALLNVQT